MLHRGKIKSTSYKPAAVSQKSENTKCPAADVCADDSNWLGIKKSPAFGAAIVSNLLPSLALLQQFRDFRKHTTERSSTATDLASMVCP
jgi:hypothetical protein